MSSQETRAAADLAAYDRRMEEERQRMLASGQVHLTHEGRMRLLDARIRRGESVTAVRSPTGYVQEAYSAEDAWLISRGRGDLASRG